MLCASIGTLSQLFPDNPNSPPQNVAQKVMRWEPLLFGGGQSRQETEADVGARPGVKYRRSGKLGGDAVIEIHKLLPTIVLCVSLTPVALAAEPLGRITGVGGIFFKSKDPKALMAWYRDVLGIKLEAWGGAVLTYDAAKHPPAVIVNAFDQATDYMAPSKREFMIDFAVDDLSAFLDRLKAKGVTVLARDDSDPTANSPGSLIPMEPRSNCGSQSRRRNRRRNSACEADLVGRTYLMPLWRRASAIPARFLDRGTCRNRVRGSLSSSTRKCS